jgi:hypothetical protein
LNCIECKLKFFIIYYRSQKTSTLQKDAGLFLSCHSLSKSGQTIGTMLGCSLTPRATDIHKKTVEKKHDTVLQTKVQEALQVLIYMQNFFSKTLSRLSRFYCILEQAINGALA